MLTVSDEKEESSLLMEHDNFARQSQTGVEDQQKLEGNEYDYQSNNIGLFLHIMFNS